MDKVILFSSSREFHADVERSLEIFLVIKSQERPLLCAVASCEKRIGAC